MSDEPFPLSRPRRWTIGDLMMGVVMASLAMAGVSLLARSRLSQEHQGWFAGASVVALLTVAIQWPVSSIRLDELPIWSRFTVCLFISVLVMAMFASLVTITALFPEGAVVVVAMMVLLIPYLSSWA
jgi:hypothetical protein